MAGGDGKLLYRGWLSTQADNGPLLYASSPTGNGEMVCAMEYDYYLSCTSYPKFNNPIFAEYDGSQGGWNWWTSFDNEDMFASDTLSSSYMGLGEPHNGIIPYDNSGNHAVAGIHRSGLVKDLNAGREWQTICHPFLLTWATSNLDEVATGKKIWIVEPTFITYFFEWPDAEDISEGKLPPYGYTFEQIVNLTRNWNYFDWKEAEEYTWGQYIYTMRKTSIGWNYRKKGYGKSIPLFPATPNWCVTNHVYGSINWANEQMLTNQGVYKVYI